MDDNQQVITSLVTCNTEELKLMVKENDTPKTFKDSLTELLDIPVDRDAMTEMVSSIGATLDIERPTLSDFLAASMITKAAMGDTKAFEVVRDTIGQKPTDKVAEDRTIRVVMDDNIRKYGE